LTCCETQANMLVIILLRNGYFFKKIYWNNIFFNIDFLYHHIEIIPKYQKILIWIKEKNKNFQFFKAYLKCKNKYALIRKFNPALN
jgi:hypothetical protein